MSQPTATCANCEQPITRFKVTFATLGGEANVRLGELWGHDEDGFPMCRNERGFLQPDLEATPRHADYPHEPGRLYDCPACETKCHCTAGHTECIFEGEHNGLAVPDHD